MKIFNAVYFSVSLIIVIFQALIIPTVFTREYESETLLNKIRKFIEQFVASAVGYVLLYYLIRKGIYAITNGQYSLLSIADILLLAISLVGISGFLSYATYTVSSRITEVLGKKP